MTSATQCARNGVASLVCLLLVFAWSFCSIAAAAGGGGGGLSIVDPNAPHVIRGVFYSNVVVSASGGTAPYSFSASAAALPAQMTLANDGTLSGTTCGSNGNYSVSFTVTDATSATATGNVQVIVNAAPAGGCSLTFSNSATLPGGSVGTAYSQTLVATGGSAPYTYQVTSGALPGGLSLSSGGVLSGTPTTAGSYSFSVATTDNTAATGVQTFSLTIAASGLALSSNPSASTQVGVAYSQSNSASGGTAPYTYSISAGALPAGVTFNTSTGLASGTPTTAGAFSYTVLVTDAGSATVSQVVSGTIAAAALSLSSPAAASTQVGVAYSQSNTASGGTAPYTYAISAGALPAGVTLNTSTGLASGTPTTAGAFSYTVRVTDAASATATQTLSGTLAAAALVLAASPSASTQVGVAYSQSNTGSGGTSPYTYAISAGALPAGVTLNTSTGLASGTPTTAGAFSYTVRVTDAASATTTQTLSGTIAAATLALSSSPPASTQVGVAYSQSNTASGGTSPYTYAISAGALPAGVTLNTSTGLVSGTPTTAGAFSYTVRVTDAASATTTQTVTGTIAAATLVLTPSPSASTQVGVGYSQSNTASGGTSPYTFSLAAGALPAGVTLNTSTGLVSGTPTAAGAFSYTVRVTDAASVTTTQTVTGTIAAATLVLTSSPSASTQIGVNYSQSNTASGGTSPYTYSVSAGALPPGLSLNPSTGVVSGTPTTTGAFSYTIRVTDGASVTATQTVSGAIAAAALALVSTGSSSTQVGTAYSQSNTANGGTAPYAYSVSAGALPAGVTLNPSTGLVSGTPTTSGGFSYTIRVTDAASATASQTLTGTLSAAALVLASTASASTQVGVAYSQSNSASGGTAPYTYSVSAGALPAGVTLNTSTGLVSGTPTTAGAFSYTIRVTDAASVTATQTLSGTLSAATLVLASTAAASMQVGAVYTQTNTASGGTAPYTYSVVAGALPAGVTLDTTTGQVSGTPTTAGVFSYTVRVTDAANVTTTQTLTGTIAPAALSLTIVASTATRVGVAYSQTSSAAGGTAPYTFAVLGGALPAGLSLNTGTGAVTGTPTAAGPFTYTLRVTDATSATATQTVAGTLASAALTVGSLTNPTLGVPTQQLVVPTGGTAPYTFTVVAGALPPGLTLAANGTLSGTPTQAGSFTFTVSITDAAAPPNALVQSFTLVIQARPDPTRDPGVLSLINQEAALLRRFAAAQLGNYQSRLQALNANAKCADAPADKDDRKAAASSDSPRDATPAERAEQRTASLPTTGCRKSDDGRVTLWSEGVVQLGSYQAQAGGGGFRFASQGITAGGDIALRPGLTVGAGLGLGHDRSHTGDDTARVTGTAASLAGYASYQPIDGIYVAAILGYGNASFDTARAPAGGTDAVRGKRRGDQWFVSLATGMHAERGAWGLDPYARIDQVRSRLNAYTESGSGTDALTFSEQSVPSLALATGFAARTSVATRLGVLQPKLSFDYRHDFDHNETATMRYADQPDGPYYQAASSGVERDVFTLGVGANLVLPSRWTIGLGYAWSRSDAAQSSRLNASLTRRF